VKNLTLITGGVRSGKSLFAESLAKAARFPIFYIATMPSLPDDAEQQTRIERHRMRRPPEWSTIEAPYTLPEAIHELPLTPGFCLIDCLSVWVSNLMLGDDPDNGPADPYAQEAKLFNAVDRIVHIMEVKTNIEFVVVTNEVGWGVVPDNALSRAYRDFLGLVNQTFARHADNVYLTAAGLPLKLKPSNLVAPVSLD
jgi:adenosylcobinamide kinase/adenosylcobinamide-phosphate guanylyltransferase